MVFLMAAVLLAGVACGTYIAVKPLTQLRFPPTASCEIFTTKAPDRPYTEIAILEVSEGGNTILAAQKKAMALGANAIVMKGQAVEGSIALGNGLIGTANKTIFVAVRWKEGGAA